MGQVYLARATGLGGFERQVVVKTLDANVADGEALVAMFLDEARLAGALHHQYIAPVFEVGRDDEGRYFLVMDYVQGETAEAAWRASVERGRALPLPFALTVVSAVASALDYAHRLCGTDGAPLDIVHRDVSLSNVMIGHDGAVKLIDFGIAKFASRMARTQVGSLKGKIAYLSPEQVKNEPVDHRADIFALGIVLYELTTMTPAFRDVSDLATLERITHGELVPPSHRVPAYPGELEAIVMKALALDPAARFQRAGELGRELEALASRLGMPLGHAAIVDVMRGLFDGPRRRLARSSAEVATDPLQHALPAPVEDDVTPVVPIELDETTEPRDLPLDADTVLVPARTEPASLEPASLEPAPLEPAPLEPAPRTEPAPLVVRIATPLTLPAPPRPGSVPPVLARPRLDGFPPVRPATPPPGAVSWARWLLATGAGTGPWARWLVAALAAIAIGVVVAIAIG